MSSSGSDEDVAIHIALERSKVETDGSSESGAQPQLPRRWNYDSGARPSLPARSFARTLQSAPTPCDVLPPPTAPPCRQCWVLVPASLARTRTTGSKACVARRERQWAREREAEQSSCRRRGMLTEPNEDEHLLAWVYRWSLTTAETDARLLRRKNAKALRLVIEQFKREAKELVEEKADWRRWSGGRTGPSVG
ncbi:Phosphorylated carbohydrates phosphatase [Hordeum vulgare]|nr:Phosphorylated carbohydrates phosphatase [Hordeum vulgare]